MRSIRLWGLALVVLMACNVQAQKVKETVDSIKSGVKSGSVKKAYSKISDSFQGKDGYAEELIGTWYYKEPAVFATKGSLLVKVAGNALSSELEKLLRDYVEKSNITPQNTRFTFYKDSRFERVISGHKGQGVWIVDGERLMLGVNNVLTADITLHEEKGELMLLMDVDKLLNVLQKLGAMKDTKTNKQLIKLSKRIPGLQAGFLVVKKQ
jgi:hypothetical protein